MRVVPALALLVAPALGCSLDWTVIPKGTGMADGGPTQVTGSACSPEKRCPNTHYCAYPDRACGLKDPGTCAPVPPVTTCNDPAQLSCMCNGLSAKTRCQAEADGQDVSLVNDCKIPADTAPCGFLFCPLDDICLENTNAPGGIDFRCVPWTCAERTCGCPEIAGLCSVPAQCETRTDATTIVRCPR